MRPLSCPKRSRIVMLEEEAELYFVISDWFEYWFIYKLMKYKLKKKLNFMVWVRERTIPTERQPLVGEVIAILCG
jgi:hypothetical protein